MFSIVPHAIVPGVDFCAVKGYHYIVRSDAVIYIKTENLNKGSDVKVFDLHYSCKGGNHYLANNGYFYIIKGKSYRRVTNMNTDADSVVQSLHPIAKVVITTCPCAANFMSSTKIEVFTGGPPI